MTLPGINQLVNNVYQKNNIHSKALQKNESKVKDGNEKRVAKDKDIYGESAKYVRAADSSKTAEAELDPVSGTSQKIELSDKAKEYLDKLRSKYSNMDIMINDNLSDSEISKRLNHSSKEYGVMIDIDTLEQMANDESVAAKYENVLDNAGNIFENMKNDLGDDAKYVKSISISIDKEGNTEYRSIIDNSLEKRPSYTKKVKDDDKKAVENKKKVSSSSLEEFIAKIKEAVAEIKSKSEKEQKTGFDASI